MMATLFLLSRVMSRLITTKTSKYIRVTQLRWEYMKGKFNEDKKESTLSTNEKSKIQEKRKKTRWRPKKSKK